MNDWLAAHNILAVRLDNIGDVIMLGPALRAVKESSPHARLTLLASPGGASAAPLLPWIDDVLAWRATWQDIGGRMPFDPAQELKLIDLLRERNFDAALIFSSFSQTPHVPGHVCYLAGISLRAGESKEFGGGTLTTELRGAPDELHQVERNLRLVECLGFVARDRQLTVAIPEEARAVVPTLLARAGLDSAAPFILVHPGASAQARRYPAQRFGVLARLLTRRGWQVLVVGVEREVALIEEVLQHAPQAYGLAGETTLAEYAALIEQAALVICNDTLPMHLADALRRPEVVLFSGTDYEEQWRPRATRSRLLRRRTACHPCYLFECPIGLACLDISPEEVVEEVEALLVDSGTIEASDQLLMAGGKPMSDRRALKLNLRRVAVFRALQLGDLLQAVPALRALRRGFPGAEITLIGLPWAKPFAQRFHHYVDRFVEFVGFPGISEVEVNPERTARFIEEQRAYNYDLAIQMHGSGQTSNRFVLALGARVTVGYYKGKRPGELTLGAPYPHDQPEVRRNLELAKLLGCPDYGAGLEFPLYNKDHAEAAALFRRLPGANRPWIGLHPGARPPARRWPAEYFASVADTLARRFNAQVILTGDSDEETTVQLVARQMKTRPLNLVSQTSLGGLAALISELDLFVSNDTGPAHIAIAVDTPSITIFGPADYRRWAPLDQKRHPIVRRPVECSPCGYWDCPIDHRCLRWVSPQMVVEVAEHLLARGTVACDV